MARDLLGRELSIDPGTPHAVRAAIVEVEAYLGLDDPASHAHRGPTPRARIMFGPPGRLYVYLSYGMHHCANLVTGPEGVAGAVLLRAARVLAGEAVVRERRPGHLPAAALLRGPGNLCRGLGLSLADNGRQLGEGRLALLGGRPVGDEEVARGPRVGISRAVDLPLRLWLRDEAAVSGARAAPRPPAAGATGRRDAGAGTERPGSGRAGRREAGTRGAGT